MTLQEVTQFSDAMALSAALGAFVGVLTAELMAYIPSFCRWLVTRK